VAEALRPAATRVGRPSRVQGKNIARFGHEMPAEMAAKLDTLADEIGTNRRRRSASKV
jgi:hypothetical protein